jgi:hypothetical protein
VAEESQVCASQQAVNIGTAYASAMQKTGNNFADLAEGLRRALAAAPPAIRPQFEVLVGAEIPFLEALAKADGNYVALATDPSFQAAIQNLNQANTRAAGEAISTWFSQHCE